MEKKKLPKALYRGKLPIGGFELDCAVLDDGTRVLTQKAVFEAFNRPARGRRKQDPIFEGIQLPSFIGGNNLLPLVNKEFMEVIQRIEYEDNGREIFGYKAEVLPATCSLYLEARRKDILIASQMKLAEISEILLSSFAKVGIIALIDEATGFQFDRKHDALRILLQQYIADGIQSWVKKFPDAFFTELDRLYQNEKTTSRTRPKYYGNFINTYIYNPIEDGYVKSELNKKNITSEGKRKARFHQWLTDFGNDQLKIQIGRVLGVMETCTSMRKFKERISRQRQLTIFPDIEEAI